MANGGEPFCPHCGTVKVYTLAETPIRWKCSGCRRKFSVTSGTIFHSRKLSIRDHLAVIALFVNGVKGVAALQMSRNMNIGPKSIFVMLHKLREAMGATLNDGSELAGEVEVDGAYFGSRIRQRIARPIGGNNVRRQPRQVVVVARERQGRAIPWVVTREGAAVPMIRQHIASGTTVHADELGEWNILHASYPMKRVNHSVEFKSEDGGCTNQAELYFCSSPPRRVWGASQDQRPSSTGIRRRNGMAGKLSSPAQRRSLESRHRRRARAPQERCLGRLLASERGMTDETHVVTANALVAKRAELLFEIGELEKQADRLRAELVHLDAVLRMFRPDFKAEGLPVRHRRPTKSPYFAHGELTKRIFDAMRERGTVTSQEIAAAAMRDKGLDPDADRATRADFVRRVALQLNDMLRKGKVEKIGRGRGIIWSLASATTSQSG